MTPEQLAEARKALAAELNKREFLLPAEAAFLVNRSKATMNRWIARGLKTYQAEGDQRWVKMADVRAWIADPATKTRPPRRR